VANQPDPPSDIAPETRAQNGWILGLAIRTGELGASLPFVTLRAWCTSATSTSGLKARIAELEASIAQHDGERLRTAERLTVLEQQCAIALGEAKVARQLAARLRDAHGRLDNEARAWIADVRDRVGILETELASTTKTDDGRAAETAPVEHETGWRQERAALEADCRQARERCAELETALARRHEDAAAWERREAALRTELEAARREKHDDPPANADLELVRTSLAEAETALQATRTDLARATNQVAALSKTKDELTSERARLGAEVASTKAELASSTEAAGRASEAAEKAQVEREARWREERSALEAACRRAQERGAELETALAQQREETAAAERRAATPPAHQEATRTPAHGAEDETELAQARASLAEAQATLEAMRRELTQATDQLASLTKAHDQEVTDRHRIAAELAVAEERAVDLERRLAELNETSLQPSRPIPI